MSTFPAKEKALGMYRKMYEIRKYEESIYYLFLEGIMPGTIHQSTGGGRYAVRSPQGGLDGFHPPSSRT